MAVKWRSLGDTTVEAYVQEFARLNSPMLGEAKAVWEAARPHSKLALAMSFVEQKHATLSSIPQDYRNPLSLARPTASPADGVNRWQRYSTWAQGVGAWRDRITSPTYKDGVYAATTTLADLIRVYAPPHDRNDTNLYIDTVQAIVNRLPTFTEETPPVAGTFPTYPVLVNQKTGQTIQVQSPVPIVQKIIPLSAARPGTKLVNARFWVQHETGNPSRGANAEMHYRFLMGQLGTQTSFHFSTDSGQIVQLVPLDEVTWQSADGGGPGNYSSWSNEGCINADGDEAAMRRNSEWLAAGVLVGMAKIGYGETATADDVKRHWDFNYNNAPSQRHHCPDNMMNDGYWPTFVNNVATNITLIQRAPVKEYARPTLLPVGEWDGKDRTIDGTRLIAMRRKFTAKKTTKVYQKGSKNAPELRAPLKPGDTFDSEYFFYDAAGKPWIYTAFGSRIPLGTNAEPRVSIRY